MIPNQLLDLSHLPPIMLRPSKNAKHLRVRMDVRNRQFILSCPLHLSKRKIHKFLETHEAWLHAQWQKLPASISLFELTRLFLLGRPYTFQYQETKRTHVWVEGDQLTLFAPVDRAHKAFAKWLETYAYTFFHRQSEKYAACINETYTDLRVRDTKSQWGSCSYDKKLTFSWRLMLAPLEVAQYVVAHEVAHLKHHNHSPAFWEVVDALIPNRKENMRWLKDKGPTLFSFLPPNS